MIDVLRQLILVVAISKEPRKDCARDRRFRSPLYGRCCQKCLACVHFGPIKTSMVKLEQGTPVQNLIVAAAGPVTNILLIATAHWAPVFALANFCYAIANTLPIEGSDGYRIALCWQQVRSLRNSDSQT